MIALARRYRPTRFADLVAQDHIATALRGAVASGRVAHGYLFAGPRGVGKTSAARILAMALNCPKRDRGEPCGSCESCQRIWTGAANLDVVELDAASNRGVDDARDLRERAMYAASAEDRFKVYIVDEAHMLTREAWNALLKILEEPPPQVVFVFATTEPHKIAQTAAPILSRLQRFDFRRLGPRAIVARLEAVLEAEQLQADPDALALIARSADGGMRDALSLLDQVLSFGEGPVTAARAREVLGLIPDEAYAEMLRLVAERDSSAAFALVDRLLEAGADLGEFVAGVGEVLRAVLQVNLGGAPEGLTEALRAAIDRHRAALPVPDVVRMLQVLSDAEAQMRLVGNARLAVELLLLRWAIMDRTVELQQVLQALGRDPGSGERGAAPPGASRADPVNAGSGPAPRPPAASPPQLRDAASTPRPKRSSPPPLPEPGPATLEHLRAAWPAVVAQARTKSPMLAAVLDSTEVAGVEGDTVLLRTDAVHAAGLERQRDALAALVGMFVTRPVRVRAAADERAPARAPRMTEAGAKAERLKALRAKDATLSEAVDALDLELLE